MSMRRTFGRAYRVYDPVCMVYVLAADRRFDSLRGGGKEISPSCNISLVPTCTANEDPPAWLGKGGGGDGGFHNDRY